MGLREAVTQVLRGFWGFEVEGGNFCGGKSIGFRKLRAGLRGLEEKKVSVPTACGRFLRFAPLPSVEWGVGGQGHFSREEAQGEGCEGRDVGWIFVGLRPVSCLALDSLGLGLTV